jgi:hypothetical protein
MAGPTPVKVACLALGSRGDVEPLLAVLERLLTLTPSAHVTLACREEVWDEIVAHRPARAGVTLAPVRTLSVAMARAMHARKQGLAPESHTGISDAVLDAFLSGEQDDLRRDP